jgi:hypothetical protein
MKQTIMLMILGLVLISAVSSVSASTLIAGKIYDSPNFETAGPVADAAINVTCNSNIRNAVSLADGTYSVSFATTECPNNSEVLVVAQKDGVSSSGTGIVHDYTAIVPDLYLGVVNIALIPEFGFYAGAVALMGAVGVFFLVRRK